MKKIYHVQLPQRYKDSYVKSCTTPIVKRDFPNATVKCIDIKHIKAKIDHINAVILNKDKYGFYLTYEINNK